MVCSATYTGFYFLNLDLNPCEFGKLTHGKKGAITLRKKILKERIYKVYKTGFNPKQEYGILV